MDGTFTRFSIVDNRIKLMWDAVYGTYNNQDIEEAADAAQGVGRQKRFWHILPEDWDSQTITWTDAPMTAEAMIASLLAAPTLDYTWNATPHAAQSAPVYDINFNNGAKLGNVLQEITEAQGLLFTLTGENTLVWMLKGEGELPTPPADSTAENTLGEALSPNAPNIRIVGDRNRYQDMPVELQADWVTAYEAFWIEPLWLAEVEARFGAFAADAEGRAKLAAKARSVTVRDYVAAVSAGTDSGGDDTSGTLADYGRWGEVGRMEIPVWVYLQDIVFKAYKVPPDYTVNSIPLANLQMVEGLLAAVDYDAAGGGITLKDPREYYPESKAFVLVQGQPLDLLDPHTQNFSSDQLDAAASLWTPCNKFNLDVKNNTVIFEHAVFVPGTGANGLFIFPNQGDSVGLDETDPLYNVCAPNANVTVTHAAVRAVLTFEAEKYSQRFGSGTRKAPQYVRSLNYHALMESGVFTEEVLYADGDDADQKATEFAAALIAQAATYATGGYRRVGAAGTVLSGTVDRVTVSLSIEEGLVERVDLTKERALGHFEPERELERRSRSKDLFPGQKNLNAAVEQLLLIAKVSKELKRAPATGYVNAADIHQRAVGAADCSMTTFDTTSTWSAGQPVYLDATTGHPAAAGTVFCGINISDQATGKGVAAATQGTVPVRVQGPFTAGDSIGINTGAGQVASKTGTMPLGIAGATYAGTSVVLAPVRLGAGSSGAAVNKTPWQPYAAPWAGSVSGSGSGDGSAPADWGLSFMIYPGAVQDGNGLPKLPASRNAVIAAPASCTDGFFVWLESTVDANGLITALDYNSGTTVPDDVTPPSTNSAGTPPPIAYDLLFILTTTETSVEWDNVSQLRNTVLTLLPVTTNTTNVGTERRMCYFPPNPVNSPY